MRHDDIADIFGCNPSRCESRCIHQTGKPLSLAAVENTKTEFDNGTVLIHQRHNIAYGTNGNQVQHLVDDGLWKVCTLLNGLRQLECNAASCQSLKRIFTSRLFRIDYQAVCYGIGYGMMVCNQYLHTKFLGIFYLMIGYAAAVHGDNQIHASFVNLLNGLFIQAIALFKSGWNVVIHLSRIGNVGQHAEQQRSGSDSVCIVVAIDTDSGTLHSFLQNKRDPFLHIF